MAPTTEPRMPVEEKVRQTSSVILDVEDMEDMGGSRVRTGVHACLPISAAAAVSRDVREIDVNNLVDILDVIRTIMYHILHYR